MVSDVALLGFLISEQLHGYEIYQRFSNLPGLWEIWRIKQSRLYAMLNRLESKGLIHADTLLQENRPARKVFSITEAGKTAYKAWIIKPVESGREFRLEFLVKLFFATQTEKGLKNQLIQRQIESCSDWLVEEQQALEALRDQPSFEKAVREFRIGQISAMLDWLSSVEALDFSVQLAK
jgi:PadR family transcriptional regulator AphA